MALCLACVSRESLEDESMKTRQLRNAVTRLIAHARLFRTEACAMDQGYTQSAVERSLGSVVANTVNLDGEGVSSDMCSAGVKIIRSGI